MTVHKDFARPDAATIEALRAQSPATLHEAMGRKGAMGHPIKPLFPGMRLCGPALTVSCGPTDNLMIHIAVALQYEHGVNDLPVVVAKGEGAFAELIKKTATEAGVPILENVPLARGLHEKVALDDYIDNEFFEAVAEVLLWAENVRRGRDGD